jgi:5-(carboxyamino)imidazole ribonucleotide synthase
MEWTDPFEPEKIKIAVLGGGQLGKMLIQTALKYNLHISAMDPDPNAVCGSFARNFKVGSLTEYDSVYAFGKEMDIITIESENVNVAALKQLQKEGKKVFPQPEVIETLQDKGLQKQFLKNNGIPTSPFILVDGKAEIHLHSGEFPFFQKLRKGGYDGKGVTKLTDPQHLDTAFDAPSILESLVNCEKEISVLVARNERGEVRCFPAVECEFSAEANLVEYLFSPASITKKIDEQTQALALSIATKLNIVGIMAVEFFITKDAQVLVNEIAPRPHNSGHHTIEGNMTSQFEQHLRAILNWPLGDTSAIYSAVLINLLGDKDCFGAAKYTGLFDAICHKGVYVHLYGKMMTRPLRKMGHITVVHEHLEVAKELATKLRSVLKVIS